MVWPGLALFRASTSSRISETKTLGLLAFGKAGALENQSCTGGLIFSSLPFAIPPFSAAKAKEDASTIIRILNIIVFISSTTDHIVEMTCFVKPFYCLLIEDGFLDENRILLKFSS